MSWEDVVGEGGTITPATASAPRNEQAGAAAANAARAMAPTVMPGVAERVSAAVSARPAASMPDASDGASGEATPHAELVLLAAASAVASPIRPLKALRMLIAVEEGSAGSEADGP